MKKISLLIFAVVALFNAKAQSRTETVEYQKISRQAIVNDFPFYEKTTRNGIEDKFQKMGYKSKEVKGYNVYRGVRLAELGPDSYDLYFMVDKKSRKDKDNSIVTMLISKGLETFVADSTDATLMANGKKYLEDLKQAILAYDLELQIAEQDNAVKSSEKEQKKLINTGMELQDDKTKLERKIEENIKAQADQKTEVEKQRQILETLKAKRKS
jgi:hypothetical protein